MSHRSDRIKITCYDEKANNSCSIVVDKYDALYICEGNCSDNKLIRKLEIAESELYEILKNFLSIH